MTAYEVVVYMRGEARRSTTHAWLTARFALEGMSKTGLRSLDDVLKPYRSTEEQGTRRQRDPLEPGEGYDERAATAFLKTFVARHNERAAAGQA